MTIFLNFLKYCLFAAEDFLAIKPNSKNGMENGLRLLVDVETFEYANFIQPVKR